MEPYPLWSLDISRGGSNHGGEGGDVMDVSGGQLRPPPINQDYLSWDFSDANVAPLEMMMPSSKELPMNDQYIKDYPNQQHDMIDLLRLDLFPGIQPQMMQENIQETVVDHCAVASTSYGHEPLNIQVPTGAYYNDQYCQSDMDYNPFMADCLMPITTSTSAVFQQDEAANRGQTIIDKPKPARKKTIHWSVNEHKLFLLGLEYFPKKNPWQEISRDIFRGTKEIKQITSHAQKFFIRQKELQSGKMWKTKRSSNHNINRVSDDDLNYFIHNGLISVEVGRTILTRRQQYYRNHASSMPPQAAPSDQQHPMIGP